MRRKPILGTFAAAAALLLTLPALQSPAHAYEPPRVQKGDLLVPNGSFEQGLANWEVTNGRGGSASPQCLGGPQPTSNWSAEGGRSIEFIGSAPCVTSGVLSDPVDVAAGEIYTAFVHAHGTGQSSIGFRFLNGDGALLEAVHSPREGVGDVTEFSAEAPEGAVAVRVELGAQKSVHFDNVLITAPVTQTGKQVAKRASFLGMEAGYDQDGRAVTFSVATGNIYDPAIVVVTDILSGEVTQTVELSPATGSWSLVQNPDTGVVYIAAYGPPNVWAWQPGESSATLLGKPPIDGSGIMYGLSLDSDGTLYGGTGGDVAQGYDGAQVWKHEPGSGFSRFGDVLTTDAMYTRAVAYEDATDSLWVGTGTKPHLFGCELDAGCTDFTHLLNDHILSLQWVYGLTAGDGYVLAWAGDSNSTGNDYLVALRTGRDESGSLTAEVVQEKKGVIFNGSTPVVDGKVYYNVTGEEGLPLHELDLETGEERILDAPAQIFSRSWEILDLRDPEKPGPSVVGFNSQGYLVTYNIQTGEFTRVFVEGIPDVSTGMSSITRGPDGRVWSSGGMTGGLGAYSPMRDDLQQTFSVGLQAESMIEHRGEVFQGTYPYGRIESFTPEAVENGKKPTVDCTIGHQQNRPYGLLGHGSRVYYGTQAGYGYNMGAFGWLDLETGDCTTLPDVAGHQSVDSLAAVGSKVYGGTNIFYAFDGTPLEDEAFILQYDEGTGETSRIELPVEGIRAVSALLSDDAGRVWAYAEGWLFVLDTETGEWVHNQHLFPDHRPGSRIPGHYAKLMHVDGTIWGIAGTRVFSFAPSADLSNNLVPTVHYQGAVMDMTSDQYGNVYVVNQSTRLLRFNPRAVS